MDVTEFRIIRPTRGADGGAELRLGRMVEVPPRDDGPAIEEGASVYDTGAGGTLTFDTLPGALGSRKTDPLGEVADPGDASILERIYAVLGALDAGLAGSNDRLSGDELKTRLAALAEDFRLDGVVGDAGSGEPSDWSIAFEVAKLGIRAALVTELTRKRPRYQRAEALTRRALIADVVASLHARLGTVTPDEMFRLVNGRTVVLDGVTAARVAPKAKVRLVRKAQVADLHVVRREWAGYLASEIASIRNVMAGESFSQRDRTIRETETTAERETERTESTEREDLSRLESELSQEINTELGITINGYVEASADFKYPVVTAHVGGGVNVGLALQRSERHASKVAREAVTRAVSRVDSTMRESRMRRELMRTEQEQTYELSNPDGGNVHAVYRWVDRVDTYQVFRYPDRFLLELEIPEPAEFYRWRTGRLADAAAAVDKPPEWSVAQKDITAGTLIELARTFRATNLPAAPEPKLSVVRTLVAEAGRDGVPQDGTTMWNPPASSKEVEIPIPTDYVATKVRYEGEGFPLLGEWGDATAASPLGYRSSFATVMIGDNSTLYWNGGIRDKNKPNMRFISTHGEMNDPGVVVEVQGETPPYGRAFLPIGGGTNLDPDVATLTLAPPVATILKVGVSTVGVLSAAVTFLVECELSASAYAAWQLSVYDALFAAWSQWKRDYEAAGVRQALLGSQAADAGGASRNEQVIREELKRESVGWLLDEPDFAGRPGLSPRPLTDGRETDFADIDFDQAREDAPTIQFLEQAFEWNNLSYMFYPYYWARRDDWEELSGISADDPEFERFLRAGSARVIIPARPGFEDAVKNWLTLGVPFINGQLPAPDEPLYVSIDREIRELTSPWEGGTPGDTWQSRVSTTLLYLEEEGDLPFVNDQHQLPAEVGTIFVPKPYITFT